MYGGTAGKEFDRYMFEGFTPKTGEFLWELSFNNERSWFMAHKDEFEDVLNRPFKALAADTFALTEKQFPQLGCELHVARIYRDARRLHGRGPYKDHLWFSIKRGDILLEGPMFWFEIGAADYSYGMGFYSATPAQMAAFRSSIDANPSRFERLAAKADTLGFEVTGEEYKRPKGDRGELINKWYNRKRMGLERSMDFGGELYSPALPETLAAAYAKLMPCMSISPRYTTAPANNENCLCGLRRMEEYDGSKGFGNNPGLQRRKGYRARREQRARTDPQRP